MLSRRVAHAGAHGFNGGKSATVLLAPGVHDIKIDYVQVPAASPLRVLMGTAAINTGSRVDDTSLLQASLATSLHMCE